MTLLTAVPLPFAIFIAVICTAPVVFVIWRIWLLGGWLADRYDAWRTDNWKGWRH